MKKCVALIVAVIVLGGGAFYTQQLYIESLSAAQTQDSLTFTAAREGTVLDAMNALSAEGKLSFSGREFAGMGLLVEEINGRRSADGYYWILRINGELSDKGVSQARVQPGDIVEWRYEKGY